MRRTWLVVAVALIAGCRRPPPAPASPVRFYVAPGLPGAAAADLARAFKIAIPTLVHRIEEAEVAWLRDPTEALALGDRAAPGSAPEEPRVPERFLDPRRRFAPVGAVAKVLVLSAREAPPFPVSGLRHLGDPRLRGRVAMAPLGRGDGPLLVAALELGYGGHPTRGWLEQVAANAPQLVESDAEAVARVVAGRATVALADSLTAGAEQARGGVKVVFPDQESRGCVTIPTALVVLPGASSGARRLSAWLAGPDAEELIARRAPGLLPLRDGAAAPAGILPVWKLETPKLSLEALERGADAWVGRLATWPAVPRR